MPHPPVGRLAPTPSGRLHLGNVCAFAAAWLSARAGGGRLLLRIEDVDRPRADAQVEASIRDDLAWLGLDWDAETVRQSARDYAPALRALAAAGHVYYCDCTRADIQRAGGVYRGRCRDRGLTKGAVRFRLTDRVLAHFPSQLTDYLPGQLTGHLPGRLSDCTDSDTRATIVDRARGPHVTDLAAMGDPVLRRRDGVHAYNLAVVADDIADGVTEVVRGEDLLDHSAVQECLWRAFGRVPPTWLHTPLIVDTSDRKLSKSHGSVHVGELRDAGWQPADVWRRVLPWLGLEPVARIAQVVARFDPARIRTGHIVAAEAREYAANGPGSVRDEAVQDEKETPT